MANVRLAHIALNCQDPIATERFYSQFFGFERTRVYDPGENQVVMIKLGECYLELFRASEPRPMAPPEKDGYAFTGMRHFCLEVEDLDALLKQLGQAAPLSLGPLDMSQYIAGMQVAWVKDPDGNIVELNQGYRDEANPPPLVTE
ncbi:VOC family protein [Vibrio navarrensis]|uniref:VOC family protein n=1 Tax=Vibrio navarrensis TaxID=29495 RepID=A0AAI9CRT9_9VIBR|nr:VOC family protein [Vibrio navarrensis]EHA1123697.1 VOC family protein [Vibrio navarrensis]ELN6931226.1 VOC family protein [Vibrio navarrensis]MBH9738544.1 glyoxalase [Vibrio navarrensis]